MTSGASMIRSKAEMIPRVTLGDAPRLSALPIATTSSPTRISDEFPSCAGVRLLAPCTRTNATSASGKLPIDVRGVLGAVVERDAHGLGSGHDVGVGEDVAIGADDHTGAGTAGLSGRGTALVGVDRDHRRLRLGEQSLDVETR